MPVRAGEIKKCVTNVAAISYFPKEFLKESRITRRSFGGRTGAAPFEFSNLLGRLVTLVRFRASLGLVCGSFCGLVCD